MVNSIRLAAVSAVALSAAHSAGQAPPEGDARSLKQAVAEFNERAQRDAVGKTQPLLTEDEVIAAILMWNRDQRPVDDATLRVFLQVAVSREVPAGFRLESMNRCVDCGVAKNASFRVWWVDLVWTHDAGGYAYRIRDRKIGLETENDGDRLHVPGVPKERAAPRQPST